MKCFSKIKKMYRKYLIFFFCNIAKIIFFFQN
jgi:hypothetical protein